MPSIISYCFVLIASILSPSVSDTINDVIAVYGSRLMAEQTILKPLENAVLSTDGIGAMLYPIFRASSGPTRDEIIQHFFSDISTDVLNDTDATLLRRLHSLYKEKSLKSAILLMGNNLTIDLRMVGQPYLIGYLAQFGGIFDFSNDSQRIVLNKAYEDVHHMKEVVKRDWWKSNNEMIAISEMHFKCNMAAHFEVLTNGKFLGADIKVSNVTMMTQRGKSFGFFSTNALKVLRLPLQSPNLYMFFILPAEIKGDESLDFIDGRSLKRLTTSVKETIMDEVKIPLFKLKSTLDVKQLMERTNIKTLFSDAADFGVPHPSKLSLAKHTVEFEVYHDGNSTRNTPEENYSVAQEGEKKVFVAGSPFVFAVINTSDFHVHFIGRYMKPQ